MVSANTKSAGVASAHAKIVKQFNDNGEMSASDSNLTTLSRTMSKMPGRTERLTVEQTMDTLFEVADSKMSDEESKKVLANLRKHVAQLE